jgi:hypothetical protein
MSKDIIAFIILLISISIITIDYGQAQSVPYDQAIGTPNAKAPSDNNAFKILGIDSTAFPNVTVNIFINKFCALTENLKKEDFKVKEEGKYTAIDNFHFTGNSSGQHLDLAVVFDDTGSMGEEISAMKSKVKYLTDTIKASGIDANYSLVSFKDTATIRTKWTKDPAIFKKSVDSLSSDGGGDEPEDSLDAIETALSMGFRPDAQKVILVISDAHAHYKNDTTRFSNYTKEQIEKDLEESGAIFIPVSPAKFDKLSLGVDLRDIANDIQSMIIDINSADFLAILDQFKDIITGTYVIEYKSPDQTQFGSRNLTISADAPGCLKGFVSSSYNRPRIPNAPPVILDLSSNRTSPQDSGTVINWTANASDPDGDMVLYRYFLNDEPATDWMKQKTWHWTAKEGGSYRVEVRVRDAKHAGPNGLDDRKFASFTITEPKLMPKETENQSPIINDLVAVQEKAAAINWTTNATDADRDQILYRFYLNNKSMTNWTIDSKWALNVTDANAGENKVEVQIRDGKHAGPDGYDDAKSVNFNLSSMKLMVKTWIKTFDGPQARAYSIQQVNDNGYIVAGGMHDAWLIKTNADGNKLWDKTFGGAEDDVAYSAQQAIEGGYIITGETLSYGSGGKDVWLVNTDSSGNILWSKTFGGPDNDQGHSVSQVRDGGFVIVGMTGYNPNMKKGAKVWLIKTDANGNKLWDKTFEGFVSSWGRSVEQTSDGGFIITGAAQVRGSGEPQNAWLIKTDSSGNKEWDRTFESTSGDSEGQSVQQTSDGGYIMLCYKYSSSPYEGIWLIKTDSQGRRLWDRTFRGDLLTDSGRSIQQTKDGGYIITGLFVINASLIKVDSEGNEEWYRTFKGINCGGNSVQQANDGGYIVAGTICGDTEEAVLIKTNADGIV